MKKRMGIWPLLVLGTSAISGWLAERNYRALPEIACGTCEQLPQGIGWPGVSVIVPARNEVTNLPALLDSLVQQHYPCYEVLIVDDASTDGTAELVRRYAGYDVHLLHSEGPPTGWTGKNYACWLGARASRCPWLLFIDADVTLKPEALCLSVSYALHHAIEALSLFPFQRCLSFWERLLLPFAYQHYFIGMQPQRIHALDGPALANGQYMLLRRESYFAVGGHAANTGSIIDDVALATRYKTCGIIPYVCRGEQVIAVRMYRSLPAIIEGFGKNAYLFLRQSPLTGLQTALGTTCAAALLPLTLKVWCQRAGIQGLLLLMAYLLQIMHMRAWSRRFSIPWGYILLTPFAALVFLGIALRSMFSALIGYPLTWKGRAYHVPHQRTRYRLPRRWFLEMGQAILFKQHRPIYEDAALMMKQLPKPSCVRGAEHIPASGSFVVVCNHYQRLDLWIGWSGAILIDAIAHRRAMTIRVVTTDRVRIGQVTIPGTRWLFARVATVWNLILVTPSGLHKNNQHYTLLRVLRSLQQADYNPTCVIMMPEGDEGDTRGLKSALPGSGRAIYALTKRGIPLVPAVVWEENGHLHIAFGESFTLEQRRTNRTRQELDVWAREQVMGHIADLLPSILRGTYKRRVYGTLG